MQTSMRDRQVYDEFIDFIATRTTPEETIEFRFSDAASDRLEDLVYRAKQGELTAEEGSELDKALAIEHIVTLAKAKARLYLQSRSSPLAGVRL